MIFRWDSIFETLLGDLRYAIRQLRKSPGFAISVVVTMAIALGANTAIFSVVRAVLMQPLPYQDPARLFCIWNGDSHDYPWYSFSYPRFSYFREHSRDLAELAAYDDEIVTLSDHGQPARVEGGRVSANFFSLLGVRPELGRTFLPIEDQHGANPVVLLSDRFWRQRYSADPRILGHTVVIDAEEFTIIGVLPRGFRFQASAVEVWRSRIIDTRTFAPASVRLGASYLTVIARLHPGITLPQFRAKLTILNAQYRDANRGNSDILGTVSAELLQQQLVAGIHLTLLVLWGAVLCLLAIACANVANLVLIRATARYREMSVRLALGATRWGIGQQSVTEMLVLSLCGALLSLPLTLWGLRWLIGALEQTSPSVSEVHLNLGLLFFTVGVATAIGIAFGLTPMLTLARDKVQDGLGSAGRRFSTSKRSTQMRSGIVAGQVALCLVLLSAGALLTQSFLRMSTMRMGLRADRVWTVSLDLMPDRYQTWQSRVDFYDEVLRRVENLPGVSMAGIASRIDLVGSGLGYQIQVEGSPDLRSRNPGAAGRSVSSNYFSVVGIPLLRGRVFAEHDSSSSTRVMIVNEAFARKFFPGQNPLGKDVIYSTDRIACEIVGVVGDVRTSLEESGADQEIYLPLSQRPWLVAKLLLLNSNPAGIGNALRRQIQIVDRGQAVADMVSFDQVISERLGCPRTAMFVVVLFAASALLLAAVGIYGVLAYSVAQRKKEIGIRMALGADTQRIHSLIFRQTFRLLIMGSIVGLPLAAVLSRVYSGLLFDVKPTDPITFLAVVALLFLVALAATYPPAARAAEVDPVVVLRAD